jgi:hypothetical protein
MTSRTAVLIYSTVTTAPSASEIRRTQSAAIPPSAGSIAQSYIFLALDAAARSVGIPPLVRSTPMKTPPRNTRLLHFVAADSAPGEYCRRSIDQKDQFRAGCCTRQIPHSRAGIRHRCHMKSQKVPSPKDIKAAAQAAAEAAQAAAETAQAVASGAMRIPPASLQLAGQIPDLVQNLAKATERLNTALDRVERYLALADPMIRTMDALLPQLEALVATGNDVYKAVSSVPGVSTLGRLATRTTESPTRKRSSKSRSTQRDS